MPGCSEQSQAGWNGHSWAACRLGEEEGLWKDKGRNTAVF